MSKFLHTWAWVSNDSLEYDQKWYTEGTGWWREMFISLDSVICFDYGREVCGRQRAAVNYRGLVDGMSWHLIRHDMEQIHELLVELGHLIPPPPGDMDGPPPGGSHDEP